MNLKVRLWWLATVTTRPIKSAMFALICVLLHASLIKVKRAQQFLWYFTSSSSTTNRYNTLTNHCLRLSRRDKTSTYLPNSACLWEYPRKFVKIKKQWQRCARVFSKNHMIVSDLYVNLTIWLLRARKYNSGVLTSSWIQIQLRQRFLISPRFTKLQTSHNKLHVLKVRSPQAKLPRPKGQILIKLPREFWKIQIV